MNFTILSPEDRQEAAAALVALLPALLVLKMPGNISSIVREILHEQACDLVRGTNNYAWITGMIDFLFVHSDCPFEDPVLAAHWKMGFRESSAIYSNKSYSLADYESNRKKISREEFDRLYRGKP